MGSFCIVDRDGITEELSYTLNGHVRQTGRPPEWCCNIIAVLDLTPEMEKLPCGSVKINFERSSKTQYYLHLHE